MSDGCTDRERDLERGAYYHEYFLSLIDYLKNSSKENYTKLKESAEKTDSVERGYFTSKTSLAVRLNERLAKLKRGDKGEWGRLLYKLDDAHTVYPELKKLSPFADKTLVFVDYSGHNGTEIKFERFENKINQKMKKEDYRIYDYDSYVMALQISDEKLDEIINSSEIVWVRCNLYGSNRPLGPRDTKGKPRKK